MDVDVLDVDVDLLDVDLLDVDVDVDVDVEPDYVHHLIMMFQELSRHTTVVVGDSSICCDK